jgi:hypothetical protein
MTVAYRKHKYKLRREKPSNHWASTTRRSMCPRIEQQETLLRVSNIASESLGVCSFRSVASRQCTFAYQGETPMLKQIARKLAVGATLLALVTPAALASTPLGTDPEPGVVHTILTFFGLA